MVPYIVDMLHDDAAIVRAAGLRTLMQVVSRTQTIPPEVQRCLYFHNRQLTLVTVITPSNAAIFPEYIIPNIKYLVRDPEVSVRCMYAQCIVQLADAAVRYLEMGQALKAHGALNLSPDVNEYDDAHFEVTVDLALRIFF